MNMPTTPYHLPKGYSINALETDYSLNAQAMTFLVPGRYYINGLITDHGRELITGWRLSASTRFIFRVHNPINEQVARASVRAALRTLACTIEFRKAIPAELTDLLVNFPLGFKAGDLTRDDRRKIRQPAYVHDVTTSLKDALRQRITALETFLALPA